MMRFLGFVSKQTSGRDSVQSSLFALSHHTPTGGCPQASVLVHPAGMPSPQDLSAARCLLWGQRTERLLSLLTLVKTTFWLLFLEWFSQTLRGNTDRPPTPKKLRTAGLSQLAFLQALGVFATNTKRISKGYSKNNRLKLVRPLASERGPGGPNIYRSADRETGHFNRFLSNARMP